MSWLAFIFVLEAGFQFQDVLLYEQPTFDELTASYAIESAYVAPEAGVELFDFLQVGGKTLIYMADTEGWQYAPFDSRYNFWARARWKFLELGREHECYHPILTARRPDLGFLYGGGDRVYLRPEGNTKR
jgi:hypothetical protein